jgi:hypothetical protein
MKGTLVKKLIIILFVAALFFLQEDGKSVHEGVQVWWNEKETISVRGDWFKIDKSHRAAIIDSLYEKNKNY